ncbi:MAG: hypothetical protein M1491_05785, partial [Deltaproteobacteria bacterium]|nr:hypothetical protein [Deltaproteobacteria bacterium]
RRRHGGVVILEACWQQPPMFKKRPFFEHASMPGVSEGNYCGVFDTPFLDSHYYDNKGSFTCANHGDDVAFPGT